MDPVQFDDACQRCAKCIDACPQYSDVEIIDSLIEYLVSGKESPFDITRCYTCGLCESVCPEKLSLKLLIKEARLKKVKDEGLSDINYLSDPGYEHNMFRTAASIEEPLLFQPGKAETVYYPGCYSSYIHKTVVQAITRLMERAGVDFAVLDGLDYCCGVVAAGTGNPAVIKANGPKLIAKLREMGAKRVVASCPGCYMALSKVYPSMFGELGFEVVHISQFLEELVRKGALRPGEGAGGKVFYHDPCHLTRGMGMFKEPRDLLQQVPGTELMNPSPEGSSCCGFGGGVRLNHPTDSIKASRQEHCDVKEKGGDIIISNCAGCRQNLIEGRPEDGPQVYDLAEYLLLSLGESLERDDKALIDLVNEAYAKGMRGYRRPRLDG
ncbi:MAG: (Fe-S)-binding protein [Methanomassiliicoccales archaeon]|nr:(Fe-S)-binding protein [Methanomassiliicoccales archaeon]